MSDFLYDSIINILHQVVPEQIEAIYGQRIETVARVFHNNSVKLVNGETAIVLNCGRPEVGKDYLVITTKSGKKYLWMPFIFGSSLDTELLKYLPIDIYSNGYMSYSNIVDGTILINRLFPALSGTSGVSMSVSGAGLPASGVIVGAGLSNNAYSATILSAPTVSGSGYVNYSRYIITTDVIDNFSYSDYALALPEGYDVKNSINGISVSALSTEYLNITTEELSIEIPQPETTHELLSTGSLFIVTDAVNNCYQLYTIYSSTMITPDCVRSEIPFPASVSDFFISGGDMYATLCGDIDILLYRNDIQINQKTSAYMPSTTTINIDPFELMNLESLATSGTYPEDPEFTKAGQEAFENFYGSNPEALKLFNAIPSLTEYRDHLVYVDDKFINLKNDDVVTHHKVYGIQIPNVAATIVYENHPPPYQSSYPTGVQFVNAEYVFSQSFRLAAIETYVGLQVLENMTLYHSGTNITIPNGTRRSTVYESTGTDYCGLVTKSIYVLERNIWCGKRLRLPPTITTESYPAGADPSAFLAAMNRLYSEVDTFTGQFCRGQLPVGSTGVASYSVGGSLGVFVISVAHYTVDNAYATITTEDTYVKLYGLNVLE